MSVSSTIESQFDRRDIGKIGCAYLHQSITLASFCRKSGTYRELTTVADKVKVALKQARNLKDIDSKTTEADNAFKSAKYTLSEHLLPLGHLRQSFDEEIESAYRRDQKALTMKMELIRRSNAQPKLPSTEFNIEKRGIISMEGPTKGFTKEVRLGAFDLNLSQSLDIALALLLRYSFVEIDDNPHFYLSLEQSSCHPLEYGKPLNDVLSFVTLSGPRRELFLVVDRNLDNIRNSNSARCRLLGNIWKTDQGRFILKDITGYLESSEATEEWETILGGTRDIRVSLPSRQGWFKRNVINRLL